MDDSHRTPEELIAEMGADELCELLEELGVAATEDQAEGIQQLVARLGSLEAAIETLLAMHEIDQRRAA